MWDRIVQEASSVLQNLKQITPSDRSGVSGNEGVGDRSEIGKKPWEGQQKIWGNLNGQSRGMEGKLDTQGKDRPELFTSKKGNTKDNNPGTYTPSEYKRMYSMHESANASATGINSGKHKVNAATSDPNTKYVQGADTNFGGSCNCGKRKPMTEAQMIGSAMAVLASYALNETSGGY